MHPLWQLAKSNSKTTHEAMLLSAVFILMTKPGFTSLTPEDTYDWLKEKLKDFNLVIADPVSVKNVESQV
jgi:hypothetical protein